MGRSSRISGFYNLAPDERRHIVADWTAVSPEQAAAIMEVLQASGGLSLEQADKMVENVVATYALPLGIATNFVVNGRDVLVPMVIEEPSVVAGASFAARLARAGGGFHAETTEPLMIGQMQVLDLADAVAAGAKILAQKHRLIDLANSTDPIVVSLHGGARDVEVRVLPESPAGPMLVVHLIYDCRDAMGANMVNTACEALAPLVEEITGGRVNLRILSNLADRRLARARCVIPAKELATGEYPGELVAQRIVEAYAFAAVDPYRAATHNKGIMNGVDAVVLATGNDWRAIEAGAHAFAARDGLYRSLSDLVLRSRRSGNGQGTGVGGQRGAAAGGGHRRRRHACAPAGAPGAADHGRQDRTRAGGDHRRGGSRPKPGGHPGAGDRGHPARPHGLARPPDRDRRRCAHRRGRSHRRRPGCRTPNPG